jgi:hypothetical protein
LPLGTTVKSIEPDTPIQMRANDPRVDAVGAFGCVVVSVVSSLIIPSPHIVGAR